MKRFNFSIDLDYSFFYPDLGGAWKKAYERASDWLLDYLDQVGLTITFFACPENIIMFPDYARRIVSSGHYLGLHIHNIYRFTPKEERDRILREGIDRIGEISGRKPQQFRGGMFYLDRDLVDRLEIMGFTLDSSLLPGRSCVECRVDGPLETHSFSFDMPMDYRNFPDNPYRLTQTIVEVPPSTYCQGWLNPQAVWEACLAEPTGLSVLYNHAKNCNGTELKESADGRMRDGMVEVLNRLMSEGFSYVSYEELIAEAIETRVRSDVLCHLQQD